MNLTKYFNPYYYIGAAVILASIVGGFYYQSREIHHYHTLFNKEHDNFVAEHTIVADMLAKQSAQSKVTETNVTRLITMPTETKTILKEIKEAPVPADCTAPTYPPEVYNAF